MKPLPDINNEAAMLLQGKRSALHFARKDAIETLRDAFTLMQSNNWEDLDKYARQARDAADRLITLAALLDELN